ncbi:MAG: hypothetical protein AVDCRST_MAG59-1913, partial [uncultured Thermomicrobiales bacterium]
GRAAGGRHARRHLRPDQRGVPRAPGGGDLRPLRGGRRGGGRRRAGRVLPGAGRGGPEAGRPGQGVPRGAPGQGRPGI